MVEWYCGACGCSFDEKGMKSEARCPECGALLKNDPDAFYNMMIDAGFTDEFTRTQ